MANRCPSCNKFSALTFEEPEEESFEVDNGLDEISEDGTVTATMHATVKITRNSECCAEVVKEASLEMSEEFTIEHGKLEDHIDKKEDGSWAWKEGCELTAACDDPEQVEEGGKKPHFGASITYRVTCECGKGDELHEGTLEEKIAASDMDDV